MVKSAFADWSRNLNRRPLQRDVDHAAQGFDLEGLLQRRAVAVFFRKPGRAIAGGKDKGDVARVYQFGDRRYHLAIDVDVENGELESGGLRQPDRLVDLAGFGRDAVAQLLQHVGDHHPDHDLVLAHPKVEVRKKRLPVQCKAALSRTLLAAMMCVSGALDQDRSPGPSTPDTNFGSLAGNRTSGKFFPRPGTRLHQLVRRRRASLPNR